MMKGVNKWLTDILAIDAEERAHTAAAMQDRQNRQADFSKKKLSRTDQIEAQTKVRIEELRKQREAELKLRAEQMENQRIAAESELVAHHDKMHDAWVQEITNRVLEG